MTNNENYGTTDAHHEKSMNINENHGNIHEDHGNHRTKLNTSKKSMTLMKTMDKSMKIDEHHGNIDENHGKH